MRLILTLGAVSAAGLALAGCSKETPTPAATTAALPTVTATPAAAASGAGFTPPTSISRADYGGRMERRFRKLDKNGDGKLTETEFPKNRGAKILKRLDKNSDNAVDASEWSTGMLARFDKADANSDGNLTSDERAAKGGKSGKRKKAMIADEGDEVDSGF